MIQTKTKIVLTVLITLALVAVIGLATALIVIFTGVYNVAADHPDPKFVDTILSTVSDKSVERHAEGIKPPPLDDPAKLELGFRHYTQMCAGCHGAPGVESKAKGFNPLPPDLVEGVADLSPEEVYWIIKHGIKMTAMPAFGSTHTEDELWAMTAFTKQLPTMKPEEYAARKAKLAKQPPMEMEHEHSEKPADHSEASHEDNVKPTGNDAAHHDSGVKPAEPGEAHHETSAKPAQPSTTPQEKK